MEIAYLVNQYPGISHSFIRREIAALERLGVTVFRYSIRRAKYGVIADEDIAEAEKTRYILGDDLFERAFAALGSLMRRPGGAVRAGIEALKTGWKSEAGLARHIVYFAEALVLAAWLRENGGPHLHAHFGTNSATVAMLASIVNDGSYSFTIHGPEEFDKPAAISLARKVEKSSFCVAVSNFGVSQIRRITKPAQWRKIKLVRCGIERAFFDGAAIAPAGKSFVCVGRLCEQKGQLTLIDAAARLKAEGYDFSIVFVGDGDMRKDVEDAIAANDLHEYVEIAGWKTPKEVRAAIEDARIFVLPSYAEGLPVSIMEAFCLERPVISTYVAGIPELVKPGENGWLAPAGDAQSLAEIMGAALDASEEALHAMGRAGKELTLERHDIDKEAAVMKSLFQAAKAGT